MIVQTTGKQISYWMDYDNFLSLSQKALDLGCTIVKEYLDQGRVYNSLAPSRPLTNGCIPSPQNKEIPSPPPPPFLTYLLQSITPFSTLFPFPFFYANVELLKCENRNEAYEK